MNQEISTPKNDLDSETLREHVLLRENLSGTWKDFVTASDDLQLETEKLDKLRLDWSAATMKMRKEHNHGQTCDQPYLHVAFEKKHDCEATLHRALAGTAIGPGEFVGSLGGISDTEHEETGSAANRNQRLETLGILASGVAHDLNNVLTPILMGIKLLSSAKSAVNQAQLLEMMHVSTQRAAGLVRQILAFADGSRSQRTSVDMKQLVVETSQFLEHCMYKSIRIETELTDNVPIIAADPIELSQVLMNLCINARDAMPSGGCLTIGVTTIELDHEAVRANRAATPGTYVLLTITDDGCGIPPDVVDHIFDPFFTTKDVGKGTGLGLATVQAIINSYRGIIKVASEVGKGTRFSVYLPAAVPALPQTN